MPNEVTKAQLPESIYSIATGIHTPRPLEDRRAVSYETYRTIRRHPTVRLGMTFAMAPIEAAAWSFEGDDDAPEGAVQFIQDQFEPLREPFIHSALMGAFSFGWSPFEFVPELDGETGLIGVKKLKSLLHDITEILVYEDTGDFAGFKQGDVVVPPERCLNIAVDVEGTYWYGEGRLRGIKSWYDEWIIASNAAKTYDQRIAGANVVVKYPPGVTLYPDGSEKDNHTIATELLQALLSTGAAVIPQITAEYLSQLQAAAQDRMNWEIDILSDNSPKQYSFVPRLAYLDKLMVRGMLVPERALLEGEHGTKAEAGVHIDMAILTMELTARHIVRVLNESIVDPLLVLNYGPAAAGKAYIVASPLADPQIEWLREVYAKVLENPQGFLMEYPNIDLDSVKDQINIPKAKESEKQPATLPIPGGDPDSEEGQVVTDVYTDE